jgi:nucleotide-binding universal stress UspA family protein
MLDVGPVPVGAGDAARELHEHRIQMTEDVLQAAVQEFRAICEADSIPYEIVREQGNPRTLLGHRARYHDLIITGLRNLFTHGMPPSSGDELLKLVVDGVRPILTVTPETSKIERVLIAYKGSTGSAEAMKRFVQFQLWPGMKVRVVSFGRDRAESEERLVHAREYCLAHGLDVETDCSSESPRDALLPYAMGWGADMLVLGSSSRSYLARKLFGETVLQVLHHADRALFLT